MPKTILVVEDNVDAREMLSVILAAEGFSIITAEVGQQALNLLNRPPPDLVITDIQMPNVDGIEMIQRMREHDEWRKIPVVVMTAFPGKHTRDAINAGANGSTGKPIQVDSLLKLVRQLLQQPSVGAEA